MMNLSGLYQPQVINSGSQSQNPYTVVVQKPIQIIPVSQMYSHPLNMPTTYQKVSFVQTESQYESAKKMQHINEQMKQIQKQSIQMTNEQSQQMKKSLVPIPQHTNIESVQVNETSKSFLEEKSRWVEREMHYKKQVDELLINNKKLNDLLKFRERETQELSISLKQEEEKNLQSLQTMGKTMQVERMKIIERNTQEQSEFMEQIRKKQIEEYEEILEENRKLQLELNKLIREKEGLAGRLEIARQETNEYQELRIQVSETENKLKERELDIFRLKSKESSLEMKVEELMQVNKKLSEGAQIQLSQNEELERRIQNNQFKERDAIEMRSKADRQIQECQQRMNSQQEYLNQILGQLGNSQQENQELNQQLQQISEEYNRLQEEIHKHQFQVMELSSQLKSSENGRLFLEDKLDKQERLVYMLKNREQELKENEELVQRLEDINEIAKAKDWEIQKLEQKLETIGQHLQEVNGQTKEKEEEIYKVLKQNKLISEAKKKYKLKVKQLEEEIKVIKENNEFKQEKIEQEEKIRKLYEDNQALFNENKELKNIIAKGQQTLQFLGPENAQLKQQIEQLQKKYEQEHIQFSQQFQAEKMHIQRVQSQFQLNEEQYNHRIRALEGALAKMRNDTLLTKNYGQYSFENMYKDFNAIQQHNQYLVEQLRQYQARLENLGLVQEKVYQQQQCKICQQQTLHPRALGQIQMNVEREDRIRMKENNKQNIQTEANDNYNRKLNTKIYNRCKELTTKYN